MTLREFDAARVRRWPPQHELGAEGAVGAVRRGSRQSLAALLQSRHYGVFMTVVALGASCDLVSSGQAPANPGDLSFAVREFAVLDDGRRITLHAERGWTDSLRRNVTKGKPLPADWGEPRDR